MKLLRVGGADDAFSTSAVASPALGDGGPASESARVSCDAAPGWKGAPEANFCPGKVMLSASPSVTPKKTSEPIIEKPDCMLPRKATNFSWPILTAQVEKRKNSRRCLAAPARA